MGAVPEAEDIMPACPPQGCQLATLSLLLLSSSVRDLGSPRRLDVPHRPLVVAAVTAAVWGYTATEGVALRRLRAKRVISLYIVLL